MRTIHIAEHDSEGYGPNIVAGHMSFPNDPERAFEYFVRHQILAWEALKNAPNGEPFALPAAWIKALAVGDGVGELNRGTKIRLRRGITAGMTLFAAYLCARLGKIPSFNSAAELLAIADERRSPTFWGAKPFGNKPEIHRAWKAMRHVAHLYAGVWLADSARAAGAFDQGGAFQAALSLAAGFLQLGLEMKQNTGPRATPWLDAELAWRLPAHVVPADLGILQLEQLDPWLLDAIKRRR